MLVERQLAKLSQVESAVKYVPLELCVVGAILGGQIIAGFIGVHLDFDLLNLASRGAGGRTRLSRGLKNLSASRGTLSFDCRLGLGDKNHKSARQKTQNNKTSL